MIYLQLLLSFMKIGVMTFGGGMAMIPLIREEVLEKGWLTEEAFLNFVAVSESTPGPIAINMATFVGSSQAGFWGSVLATLGVVIPSFVIILVIAALVSNLLKNKVFEAALTGIRPCVVGLIVGAGSLMLLSVVFRFKEWGDVPVIDWKSICFFIGVVGVAHAWKRFRKKKISTILLIGVSACAGWLVFG